MLLWILLSVCCLAAAQQRSSSYFGEYGGGKRFSQSGNQLDGPITALRIRSNSSYITGLQVRYGTTWSKYEGDSITAPRVRSNRYYITGLQVRYGTTWSKYESGKLGDQEEVFLHPGENIIQVSGKYSTFLRKLIFVTNKGRYLSFGKDYGTSFNGVPLFPNTVLRFLSGSSGSVIDAIGFHWDYPCSQCNK